MIISRRRWQMLVILLLIASCIVIIAPVRTWIVQRFVVAWIDPRLSAERWTWHSSEAVIEAEQVAWRGGNKDRAVKLTAQRAWLAVDKTQLLERKFQFPKILLEDARLYLDDRQLNVQAEPDVWQRYVALRLAMLDWDTIQSQFESLIAIRGLSESWHGRIDRWVHRSTAIVTQADLLAKEVTATNNPLRVELLRRTHMEQLNSLTREQRLLADQFDAVENLLSAESNRMKELLSSDLARLDQLACDQQGGQSGAGTSSRISDDLASELAKIVWNRYAPFAEITDRMAHGCLPSRGHFQANEASPYSDRYPWIDCELIKGTGEFEHRLSSTPFSFLGNWTLQADPTRQPKAEIEFDCWFYPSDVSVVVHLDREGRLTESNQVVLTARKRPAHQSPAKLQAVVPSETPVSSAEVPDVELSIISQGDQIDGVLEISSQALYLINNHSNSNIRTHIVHEDVIPEAVRFQISGTWISPLIELDEAVPAWYLHAVQTALQRELEQSCQNTSTQLQLKFDAHIKHLQSEVATAVAEGKRHAQQQGQRLIAASEKLDAHLQGLASTEFARSEDGLRR